MSLEEVVASVDASTIYASDGWENTHIGSVVASDMISDILVGEGEDQLLVTSLTSTQMVRTAGLIGTSAILLVNRRQVPPALEEAARSEGIPVFLSGRSKYEVCVRIGQLEADG